MKKKSKYEEAGVSIDRGNEAVNRIKAMVRNLGVNEIGKFSGFFPLPGNYSQPLLVSSADGVGTKLKIAFLTGRHNTVGRCLVNHCVNDILVYGAKPLFFLDYIGAGKVEPDVISQLVSGILDGCLENNFVLLGGETAEMPGLYQEGEYDLAGFIVGMVDREKVVDGKNLSRGDLLIGLPSSGLHTNGYSLARHIVFEKMGLRVDEFIPELKATVGDELLKVHRSYLAAVTPLLEKGLLKGMAHITGGGLLENLPRILSEDLAVTIEKTWPEPEIFSFLCSHGEIDLKERFRVFNMGIGMVLLISRNDLSAVEGILRQNGEAYYLIGQVRYREGGEQVLLAD